MLFMVKLKVFMRMKKLKPIFDAAGNTIGYTEETQYGQNVYDQKSQFLGFTNASGTYDQRSKNLTPENIPGILFDDK